MYSKRTKRISTNATVISEVLSEILPTDEILKKSKTTDFFKDWQNIIGQNLAQYTKPHSLNKGILTIETADAVIAQEISLLQSVIKSKLSELGYGGSVSKIKCIITNPNSIKKL